MKEIKSAWRVAELACPAAEAPELWRRARALGAVGAVTSGGSAMNDRESLRLYWREGKVPESLDELGNPSLEPLVEESLDEYWRAELRPVRGGEKIGLTPHWITPEPEPGLTWLKLDPGMAFGGGDHPTTLMCIELLEGLLIDNPPARMLDVGAGTGVLSLACAALGCEAVNALDIDPFCFASCERNIALNSMNASVRPLLASLDLHLAEEPFPIGGYNLVVSNMVGGQLTNLADELLKALAPGGGLVLSGFTTSGEAQVLDTFSETMRPLRRLEREGWVALALTMEPVHVKGAS